MLAAQIVTKVTMQYLWLIEDSKDYTAFVCHVGQFRFNMMSFGLVNSGATYSRLHKIVSDGAKSIDNFVDDVIVPHLNLRSIC